MEVLKVPPITRGIYSLMHRDATAMSNLSPQSMQLYTNVDLLAKSTIFYQFVSAFPLNV
jgi:hypothetical protein